ncbi:MAG: esterase family protein [Anaerolineae bacterium]|nr:esterase family protein [Anaerolineae bacterium]
MALIRMDHVPETVKVNLPLNVILPDPGRMGGVPVARRKVLYLLHGLSEDATAWQRYSSIEALAAAYGLVVVMPSAGRSFYTDQPNGQRYFAYLTDELPQYLADVFGLAPRREDTYIAGNSMGGYGAFKAALLRPERYAAAASFSGVLSLAIFQLLPDDPRRDEFACLFGDLGKLAGSEHDPAVWLQRAARDPARLPRLYIAVSRGEDIYPLSGMFHAACQSLGVQSEYYEGDGAHDWFFWDAQIRRFLAALLGPMPTA